MAGESHGMGMFGAIGNDPCTICTVLLTVDVTKLFFAKYKVCNTVQLYDLRCRSAKVTLVKLGAPGGNNSCCRK